MSNSSITVPLQSKVSLTLVLLIAAFIVGSYAVLRTVIAPAFDELELSAAHSDLHRAEGAILTDIENLEAITADWAPWDEIYYYVSGQNPGFRKSNLDRPTLTNLGLDLMAIYNSKSEFVWGQVLVDGEEVSIDTLEILSPGNPASEGLTEHSAISDRTVGFVRSLIGPMIISSRPILKSDDSGPVAGALVMGQLLDIARLTRLRERTEVDMLWIPTIEGETSFDVSTFSTESTAILGRKTLSDVHGKRILLLQTRTPRNISFLGAQTINAAMSFLLLAGVLVTAFIWIMLRGTVLRPIEQLTSHIHEIQASGDLSRQINMPRGDEIGRLARQFNFMVTDVHDVRKALLDQSFKAGKADTAAEVLHNIRNAMTPMINGIDRLRKFFGIADKLRIPEAVEELANPECLPERKQKFLQYIEASFDHIRDAGGESAADLRLVLAQAKQVEGILSDQERFAKVAPIAENVAMHELLDEAAHVIPKEGTTKIDVNLDVAAERAEVHAHRIGLVQVMGNLILNAYESIARSGRTKGQIALTASDEIVDETPMVRVTIRDNGSGFDADTKSHIFQRGYTSKTRGETTGLGLHWCANAVAGMGGRISAESDGEGCGAEFHVLLPAAQGG
ncbi:MAG: HAMP domain-containing protein [Gammaproteobacteria bacterium]|nr:HAMP domain-containing protein [Gammaproteobacteria bacterium]